MNITYQSSLEETLNHVVEAIHNVVRVEVTIVDSHYKRLAGTGFYAGQIGKKVSSQSVFAVAMKTQKSYIIDSPGTNPICTGCGDRAGCTETAEVCCPIVLESQSVGAIGLIAFDEEQRMSLLEAHEHLLPFLENMASLIASKIKEINQSKELEMLTDAVEDPLFAIAEDGLIIRKNVAAEKIMKAWSTESESTFQGLFGEAVLKRLRGGDSNFQVKSLKKQQTFELKARVTEAYLQYVIILKPVKEVIGYVNRYFNHGATTKFEDIWGEHPCFVQAKRFAEQAAHSTSTVLVLGESGTGKELFARAIHSASPRNNQVFLAVNCAAIPESLLESELFGYEEGAFTGAMKGGRIGRFEQAHKGTLFLDEIGDMPLHLQSKLLRVLQESRIQKIGASKEIPVDVRIIAATNQNLEQMVKEGSFRRDLFYRINVIPIEICPLRDRLSDMNLLANKFLEKSCSRLSKNVFGFAEDVLVIFKAYEWPGNVRELENVVEYMVNMCEGTELKKENLPMRFSVSTNTPEALPPQGEDGQTGKVCYRLEQIEEKTIRQVLNTFGRDRLGIEKSCVALGVSRATLYRKMKLYKIEEKPVSN